MIDEIKKKLDTIDDNALYSPKQVLDFGVITNTKLEPSVFTFYRLIKRGQLKAVNLGSGGSPRYFVKGKDLRDYIEARYDITSETN